MAEICTPGPDDGGAWPSNGSERRRVIIVSVIFRSILLGGGEAKYYPTNQLISRGPGYLKRSPVNPVNIDERISYCAKSVIKKNNLLQY